MIPFKQFFHKRTNVTANELQNGDRVVNINPRCKHYSSVGTVNSVKKIANNRGEILGNKVCYKCNNTGSTWRKGDNLEKTEIQLKKI